MANKGKWSHYNSINIATFACVKYLPLPWCALGKSSLGWDLSNWKPTIYLIWATKSVYLAAGRSQVQRSKRKSAPSHSIERVHHSDGSQEPGSLSGTAHTRLSDRSPSSVVFSRGRRHAMEAVMGKHHLSTMPLCPPVRDRQAGKTQGFRYKTPSNSQCLPERCISPSPISATGSLKSFAIKGHDLC